MTAGSPVVETRRTTWRPPLPRPGPALAALLGLVIVLLAWSLASRWYAIPSLFPGPSATADELGRTLREGTLLDATEASLKRIAIGFLIGSGAGILLGLAAGSSRVVWWLTEPFVNFFRFIPPLAWFAPVLLWFGAGESSKIVLIVYTTVFVVTLNTMAGVQAVPENKLRMAASFGARWHQTFLLIRLPGSMPYILAGMRIAMGNAFMTVVAAEMLGAQTGLGVNITNAMTISNVRAVFASLIVLGILGLLSDRIFVAAIRRFAGRFGAAGAGATSLVG